MKQQLKQLSGDTVVYGVTTILQRFLSFILTPFYTHFLIPEQLGLQTNIFVVISFLMVLANAGMESAFFRYYSIAETDEEKKLTYWNALTTTWLVGGIIGLFIIIFPETFNSLAYLKVPINQFYLLRYAGIIIFLDLSLIHI